VPESHFVVLVGLLCGFLVYALYSAGVIAALYGEERLPPLAQRLPCSALARGRVGAERSPGAAIYCAGFAAFSQIVLLVMVVYEPRQAVGLVVASSAELVMAGTWTIYLVRGGLSR
jgi:hypothetical protein